jgi:hypothetical protein
MSGQLVGEVIAASHALHTRGLSERGFHALIAIAEKCHTQTRQGSVRWEHICDGLYGASKRTAERAVQDLKTVGALRVIKPGFGNQHGRMCAPLYQIEPLLDTDTQVTRSHELDTDNPDVDTDKPGGGYRHPGVVLDGSIDGSIDGSTDGGARAHARGPQLPAVPDDNPPTKIINGEIVFEDPDPEPPRFCPEHMPDGTSKPCWRCQAVRVDHERWTERHPPPRPSTSDRLFAETQALKDRFPPELS